MGAETVEARMNGDNSSKSALLKELAQSQEIAIPSPVMERRQDQFALSCQLVQFPGLLGGRGQRFIHNDMLAGQKGLSRDLYVRVIRCGNHHKLYVRRRQHLLHRAEEHDSGVIECGPFSCALHDGRQLQPRHGRQVGAVEDAPSQPVAYDRRFNGGCVHGVEDTPSEKIPKSRSTFAYRKPVTASTGLNPLRQQPLLPRGEPCAGIYDEPYVSRQKIQFRGSRSAACGVDRGSPRAGSGPCCRGADQWLAVE